MLIRRRTRGIYEAVILAQEIQLSHRPRPLDRVRLVDLGDEVFVYDHHSGSLVSLNNTGRLLWGLFDGTATIDDIALDVADAFGIGREAARADVLSLARRLGEGGFLEGVATDVDQLINDLDVFDEQDEDCDDLGAVVDEAPTDPFDNPRYRKVSFST